MKTRVQQPTPAHRAFRDDIIALLKKHAGHLSALEMLALACHLVGQLIAMQDQRKVTREMALQILMKNVEQGNAEAIAQTDHPKGAA